jgi:hypothetical protein
VMQWSERFYSPVFSPYGDFKLSEHGGLLKIFKPSLLRAPCGTCLTNFYKKVAL